MVKEKHQEHLDNEKLIPFEVIFKNLLKDLVFYSLREITLILPCVTYKKKKNISISMRLCGVSLLMGYCHVVCQV